jgi:hypothetical protein
MKVFISWSGATSGQVAKLLRSFLQDVNQQIEPWLSTTDLAAGTRWGEELAKSLDKTNFGVICLTREALDSPWLLFEAGALSKSVAQGRVCPYLIGIRPAELTGPLRQFQSKLADRDGTFDLLTAINESAEAGKLPADRLLRYFGRFWGDLEAALLQATRPAPVAMTADDYEIRDIMYGSTSVPALRDGLFNALTNSFEQQDLERLWRDNGFPVDEIFWQKPIRYVVSDTVDLMMRHGHLMSMLTAVVEGRKGYPGYAELKLTVEKLKEEIDKRKANPLPVKND